MTTPPPGAPGPAEPSPVRPGPVVPGSPPPAPRPPASGARIADVTVSAILMIVGVIGFAMLALASVFLVMMSDGCFDDRCNTDLMTVGWLIALVAPPAVFVAAVVWTLVRIARRRTAWWVPIVGAVLAAAIWFGGVALMDASLGR